MLHPYTFIQKPIHGVDRSTFTIHQPTDDGFSDVFALFPAGLINGVYSPVTKRNGWSLSCEAAHPTENENTSIIQSNFVRDVIYSGFAVLLSISIEFDNFPRR